MILGYLCPDWKLDQNHINSVPKKNSVDSTPCGQATHGLKNYSWAEIVNWIIFLFLGKTETMFFIHILDPKKANSPRYLIISWLKLIWKKTKKSIMPILSLQDPT
jgi:hypothetical protein